MPNPIRTFIPVILTGALLAGGFNLSSASVGSPVNLEASGGTGQQEAMGASQPGPFACPAQVLAIMAEALKQASISDARVVDGKESTTDSTTEQTLPTVWGM